MKSVARAQRGYESTVVALDLVGYVLGADSGVSSGSGGT
jgi:hypothetical protein